jgi:hypothetical protein
MRRNIISQTGTYIPEHSDCIFHIVVHTTIISMSTQIIEIIGRVDALKQDLDFLLVEHPAKKTLQSHMLST